MNPQNVKTSSNLSEYFSESLMSRVRQMEPKHMMSLLKDLEGTEYWIAIIKYSHERMNIAQQALYTLDPFKEQTAMARYQGILTGLTDIQEVVITMKQAANKVEEESVNDTTKEPEPMGY